MPGLWKWYHADSDQADEWRGAFATKQEAITEGNDIYDGESFWVCEARSYNVDDLDPIAADFLERLADRHEEMVDQDGELFGDPTTDQIEDLERRLKRTLVEWVEANPGLRVEFWGFAEQRGVEKIAP